MESRLGGRVAQMVRYLLVSTDTVSLFTSLYLSYLLLPHYRQYLRPGELVLPQPFLLNYFWLLLPIFPIWYVLANASGLYSRTELSPALLLWRTVRMQFLGLLALSVLVFALKLQDVPRLITFGFIVLYVPISVAAR